MQQILDIIWTSMECDQFDQDMQLMIVQRDLFTTRKFLIPTVFPVRLRIPHSTFEQSEHEDTWDDDDSIEIDNYDDQLTMRSMLMKT